MTRLPESVEIDSVVLTPAQARRYRSILRSMVDAGKAEAEAERAASDSWRALYRLSDGKWIRRTIVKTTRGFSFAQRPEESNDPNESDRLLSEKCTCGVDAANGV